MSSILLNPYLRASVLGAMAGIRSLSATTVLSLDASRTDRDLEGTVFSKLASPTVSRLLVLAELGEIVADKLPFVPNRTDPLPLLGRILWGGAAGAAAFAEAKKSALLGAAIAAQAAVISTNISFRLRAALSKKIPGPVAGLVGDAAVILLGYALLRGEE